MTTPTQRGPVSMTGFGVGRVRDLRHEVRIEIRAVNHRGLTLRMHLGHACAPYEPAIDDLVRARLTRGAIHLGVVCERIESASQAELAIDEAAFTRHAERLRSLAASAGVDNPRFETILELPGVLRPVAADVPAEDLVLEATRVALDDLEASRRREGQELTRELRTQLDALDAAMARIEARVPAVVAEYEKRLEQRIVDFLARNGQSAEAVDVLREVALYAEKTDVREETVRFRSHLDEFRRLLASGATLGRRPEFLTQELLREANTMGSKSNDAEFAREVIEVKATLDRIREQGQNLE